MEMEPSNIQVADKVEETDQIDPEPMKAEEPKEKPKAASVSALDMILKSLTKTTVFSCDLLIASCPNSHEIFVKEYLSQLYDHFLNKLSLMEEENGVSEILVTVLKLLPRWNRHLEVYELMKMICSRCKMYTEYPPERSYCTTIVANSLRETKHYEDWRFENFLKFIKIHLKMHCKGKGCEKRNYVDPIINKLPSVFTIALEWENNETEQEIVATTSVLATEIDISEIYKYEGDSIFTKYHLASMVCSHGDEYDCVAYENNGWVRYFRSETQFIGDWSCVLSSFIQLNMRPEILFYDNTMQRKQIVHAQINTQSALIDSFKKQWY